MMKISLCIIIIVTLLLVIVNATDDEYHVFAAKPDGQLETINKKTGIDNVRGINTKGKIPRYGYKKKGKDWNSKTGCKGPKGSPIDIRTKSGKKKVKKQKLTGKTKKNPMAKLTPKQKKAQLKKMTECMRKHCKGVSGKACRAKCNKKMKKQKKTVEKALKKKVGKKGLIKAENKKCKKDCKKKNKKNKKKRVTCLKKCNSKKKKQKKKGNKKKKGGKKKKKKGGKKKKKKAGNKKKKKKGGKKKGSKKKGGKKKIGKTKVTKAKHGLKLAYMSTGSGRLTNEGNAMVINGKFGGITYKGVSYRAFQILFHHPSEHTFNGKRSALEIQVAHRSKKNLLLFTSALYDAPKIKGSPSAFLQAMGFTKNFKDDANKKPIGVVDLSKLAAFKSGEFYHYTGSTTYPPCVPKVPWFIAKKKGTISKRQASTLKKAYNMMKKAWKNNGNARISQKLSGRKVTIVKVSGGKKKKML